MVVGLGTDLTEIERIQHSLERFGERFLRRVYTDDEIAYCRRKTAFGGKLCGAVCGQGGGSEGAGYGDQPAG